MIILIYHHDPRHHDNNAVIQAVFTINFNFNHDAKLDNHNKIPAT